MPTLAFTTETPIGEIAAAAPLATRVFARHGIDFCCGAGLPLAEVCATHGLRPEDLLVEIRKELETPRADASDWAQAPLGTLIDHIESAYHRPLEQELPRIGEMAKKVYRVHGAGDPKRLKGVLDAFMALANELVPHMLKEEEVLFPMIREGHGQEALAPIDVMRQEHDMSDNMLRHLRELTDDYTLPEGACNTWRALWSALEDLERSLRMHVHLENEILFPRALAAESPTQG